MVADGMTNRQIAQALFISMATVAVHLARAYQKLCIGRRDGLARGAVLEILKLTKSSSRQLRVASSAWRFAQWFRLFPMAPGAPS